jgi:ribonucleoside-diphosphate reductase alpha chain
VEEGRTSPNYVSKGLTRSRTDKLVVMQGGADRATDRAAPPAPGSANADSTGRGGATNITAFGGNQARAEITGAATALKSEPEQKLSPTQALEQLAWTDARSHAKAAAAEKRAEARAKGYEGEACGECGNFTLVRNGTCLKCDTCGSTTGCS